MDFIHSDDFFEQGDIIVLNCDTQCNFRIMDDVNFSSFRGGGGNTYYGGFFRYFPARIVVPHSGHWNIVIDLGGGRAVIRYGLSVIRASALTP